MKTAKVIPLFKVGDKASFNNYRPVSLLSQFSKILEKLFDVRLQAFIDKHKLLSNSQYGFRSNCSTSLALMELIEEIRNLDSRYTTRHENKFRVKYRRTNVMAYCISNVGTNLWNKLPSEIVNAKSIYIFKSMFKKYIFSRY